MATGRPVFKDKVPVSVQIELGKIRSGIAKGSIWVGPASYLGT